MNKSKFDTICGMVWRTLLIAILVISGLAVNGVLGFILGCVGWFMVCHYVEKSMMLDEACEIIAQLMAENQKLKEGKPNEEAGSDSAAAEE